MCGVLREEKKFFVPCYYRDGVIYEYRPENVIGNSADFLMS